MSLAYRKPSARRMISLTPLIDVVFILLIFFMLASSFLDWRSIDLKLPQKAAAGSSSQTVLVVLISDDGTLKVDGAPIADDALEVRLSDHLSANEDGPILVRAAEGVPLQRSIQVLEKVTASGGHNVSLSRLK